MSPNANLFHLRSYVLAVLSLALGGCSTMRSEVTINAPAGQVWAVLTDIDDYAKWNPFFVSAKGYLAVGEALEVTMQPVGTSAKSFSPKVLEIKPQRSLVWRGRLIMAGLFDGTHRFTIEPVSETAVKFTQEEKFSGLLVPFVGFDPYRKGWEKMNIAIKQRVELAK